jgi:glycerophosphoryl diester phosphodiesterase
MPAIIAHRGASLEAPENTIRAFERAIGIGVDRIELDLRRAADGGIVVIHDDDLERLCGDERHVNELSLAELRALPVLEPDYGTAPNMRVPEFDEVLDRIAPRCPLYLELKDDPDPVAFTLEVLDLVPNGTVHRIASFDPTVVRTALENGHHAVLIADDADAIHRLPEELRPRLTALSLRHDAIDESALALVRSLGIETWAWTVDHPDQWDRLVELGATDAWCTNDPRKLRAWLEDRRQ